MESHCESKRVDIKNEERPSQNQNDAPYGRSNPCKTLTQYAGLFATSVLSTVYPAEKEQRLPEAAYLQGDPYYGQLWNVFDEDGKGSSRMIEAAALLAKQNPQGLCEWRFGPRRSAVLITRPHHIKALVKDHADAVLHHDSTGSFDQIVGPKSIFHYSDESTEWQELRAQFTSVLLGPQVLNNDMPRMNTIINSYIDKMLSLPNKVVDIKEMAHFITMDMIGIKLGFGQVSDHKKRKAIHFITQVGTQLATQKNQVIDQYVPSFFQVCRHSAMQKLIEQGNQFMLNDIIPEQEGNILASKNWLNPFGKTNDEAILKKIKKYLYSQPALDSIKQFYVVGSETTATLMMLVFMLLADPNHKAKLEKVRSEIDALSEPSEHWTRETLAKLNYLNAVIMETLRLYPPIPDMVYEVTSPFHLSPNESKAGAGFKPGDKIIVSARTSQRLPEVWGFDADLFRPERFEQNKPDEFQFFPFGFGKRRCPGREFAKQEVLFTVAKMVSAFDFCFVQEKHLAHPFETHQVFTLQLEESSVGIAFHPRNQHENIRQNRP